MKNFKKRMLVRLLAVFVLLGAAVSAWPAAPALATTTTITETFKNSTADGWTVLPSASLTSGIVDPSGEGWLRLTSNGNNQAGAAFFNTAFPSDASFDIEFDYATWGGTGADGLTFFMIDGSQTPSSPGGLGGAMGYGGISGAYFATAFYEYDNKVVIWYHSSWINSVSGTIATGNRAGAKHVHITFYQNIVSVWLAGEKVIDHFSWNGTLPETLKFGFSGATGGLNNLHEVRDAVIRVSTTDHDPTVVRVTPSGSSAWPCGASWSNSCYLKTALIAAVPGDQLWVAAGTYYPGPAEAREVAFQINNGVSVYGGFASGETSLGQRDPAENITILSGDIDQNGILDTGNAYHVVKFDGVDEETVLNGVTIKGGRADGNVPDDRGGGIYNDSGNPKLEQLKVSDNSALYLGGGMYNEAGSPTITDSIFQDNLSAYGGGMANKGMDNNLHGNARLDNVTFKSNHVHMGGGGMYNFYSSPEVKNVTFKSNWATYGGGMANYHESNPAITNAVFEDNYSIALGGGIYNQDSSPVIVNNTIGGDANEFRSRVHPSLLGNTSWHTGGGIYSTHFSAPKISNTIIWGNTALFSNQISDGYWRITPTNKYVDYSIRYCDVEDGFGGEMNIDSDPLFEDPASGNLSLQEGSGAINAGLNSEVPANILTDRAGGPRYIGPAVDMGAYESPYGFTYLYLYLPLVIR
jgi:hypothetical protein